MVCLSFQDPKPHRSFAFNEILDALEYNLQTHKQTLKGVRWDDVNSMYTFKDFPPECHRGGRVGKVYENRWRTAGERQARVRYNLNIVNSNNNKYFLHLKTERITAYK